MYHDLEVCKYVAALSYLTGPMWPWEDVGVTLLWDPELTPGWPSQVCLCLLSRPRCPCGDLGDLLLWLSVLGEGGLCLACVCGLDEWEAGLEQRLGMGFLSCVVTEIWGSDRPAEWKKMTGSINKFSYINSNIVQTAGQQSIIYLVVILLHVN